MSILLVYVTVRGRALNGNLLVWGWVFASSHPPWAIDSADCAARIAVSATMCHALCSRVRVDNLATSSASCAGIWGGGCVRINVAPTAVRNSSRVHLSSIFTAKGFQLGRSGQIWQTRGIFRDSTSFALSSQQFFFSHFLLHPFTHPSSRSFAIPAERFGRL